MIQTLAAATDLRENRSKKGSILAIWPGFPRLQGVGYTCVFKVYFTATCHSPPMLMKGFTCIFHSDPGAWTVLEHRRVQMAH